MTDIAAAAEAAHSRSDPALVAVDNTLMGPALQHPLTLNADLSLYSGTKYLSGFSDMLAGVILGPSPEMSLEDLHGGGVFGSLVRISVGVEDWRDLLSDIRQALD